MKAKLTEVVFIIDRSGSMSGLEEDTIGGFNSMLKEQQSVEGECKLTTVLFDNRYELLHDRADIWTVKPLTSKEYYVRGNTALLDAVGKTISSIVNLQKSTSARFRAEKTIFIIITDGMENASREYSYSKVKTMIEHQKERYHWEFIFLAANIDAAEEASRIGIGRNRAQSYHNDTKGIKKMYDTFSAEIAYFRCADIGEGLSEDWGEEIKKDFLEREK